jgi:hypothetical protein
MHATQLPLRTLGAYFLVLVAGLGALPLQADPVILQLPVSGLKLEANLPADAGTWAATEQSDASGRVDLLTRTLADKPALSVVIAVAPAGTTPREAYDRLTKRAGLTLVGRPAYLGDRWSGQATEEVDFANNTTIHAACAEAGNRLVVIVVAYVGDTADLGRPDGAAGTLLDAILTAAAAGGDSVISFASPGTPLQPAVTSLTARVRLMADPASATAAMAARTGMITMPAGVSVIVALGESLNSSKAKTGQKVKVSVMQDVVYDGAVIIRKGTPVSGRVGDASSGSLGGKGGKLKIELDSTTAVDGTRVPLLGTAETEGKHTKALSVKGYLTGWGLFSKGSKTTIPAGTPLEAKTTGELHINVGEAK